MKGVTPVVVGNYKQKDLLKNQKYRALIDIVNLYMYLFIYVFILFWSGGGRG